MAAADVEQPLGGFGNVAGDGMPAIRPMSTDSARVALVIGQPSLEGIDRYVTPRAGGQRRQLGQAGTRIPDDIRLASGQQGRR